MQFIETRANELAALGKPLGHENLIEKILEALDDEYQLVIDAINGRDAPISFDELYEKLINKELSFRQKTSSSPLPASANPTNTKPNSGHNTYRPPSSPQGPAVGQPTTN